MFDYSQLTDRNIADLAQGAAERIKSRSKPTAQHAVEIGQDLEKVYAALPHGQWGVWLQAEFGWSESTALRYRRLAKRFKSVNLTDLEISLSALHLLASPSVDDDTLDVALAIAHENGGLTHGDTLGLLKPDPNWTAPTGADGGDRWQYEPPQEQGEDFIFTAATAVVTRTRKIELTDEVKVMMEMEAEAKAADMEIIQWPDGHQPEEPQPQMPGSLTRPIFVNPPVVSPPALAQAMDYLNRIYEFKTGRPYFTA